MLSAALDLYINFSVDKDSNLRPNEKDKEFSAVRQKISVFQHENEEMATAVLRMVSIRCYLKL